jgi:glycosyltransferase involved in cell wall biosynthesis
MKKVLYIVSTLKKTGPIVVLANIVKYLDRTQFEPIVLTLSSESKDSMIGYFKDNLNVKIDSLRLSRIEGMFSGKSKIEKYIKENNIDIVHTHGIRADGFLKKINILKVSTLHNYPYYDYTMKFSKLKAKIMIQNHMSTIKLNRENVIACSKTISKEFEQNGLTIFTIQNGVDTESFTVSDEFKKLELKEKLEISKDKKIFITVGSLIPRKDMKTVIDGFKLYNKDNDSILLIAGDGFEKEKLESISDNNIMFLGNIPNVVEYLQLSDCFISASLAEGLPNTVLEAMACGLPTVLSAIPSHLELFEGEDVEFFEIKDTQKLSELLLSVSNNFEEKQALSLKMIRENFSAKVMSQKYQEVYMEKINERI